jgi:uncharacterized protein DUF6982
MQEKVVVHFRDGRLLKGYTSDLTVNQPTFRLTPVDWGGETETIQIESLKAVFFVKDFAGDSAYSEKKAFAPDAPYAPGRVEFHMEDGESLVGVVQDYQPDEAGFFLVPADPQSNNVRCFVVGKAIKRASLI